MRNNLYTDSILTSLSFTPFTYISGTAIGVVIYTGPECRATMNNSKPRSKVGLVDIELNDLTKILIMCVLITCFYES